MAALLDPLTSEQQWLVDLVAEAYLLDDGQWPIFDYLDARFDEKHKDAWETLYSLPRSGAWHYGAAWWVGLNQPQLRPTAETHIELTVLGMHHSSTLKDSVGVFLLALRFMAELHRRTPAARQSPRRLEIDAATIRELMLSEHRGPLQDWTLDNLPTLWRREPATWSGGESRDVEGVWTKGVTRNVLDYEGVSTIEEYVDRLEALTATPSSVVSEAAPSPLGLVSALDYLDMGWRVVHGSPLFSYPSAERAAKLSYDANTTDELDSRLTALGEILRTANATVRQSPNKLAKQTHEAPLAPLEDFLGQQASLDHSRIADAITTLEAALSIRDAAQHTEAGGRAVRALATFGLAHPVRDPQVAWSVISVRVVNALNAIREEVVANL